MKYILVIFALLIPKISLATEAPQRLANYFIESAFKINFRHELRKKVLCELGESAWDEIYPSFDFGKNGTFFSLVRKAVIKETDQLIEQGVKINRGKLWEDYYGRKIDLIKQLASNILADIDFRNVSLFYPLNSYTEYMKERIAHTMQTKEFINLVAQQKSSTIELMNEAVINELIEYFETKVLTNSAGS